MPHNYFISKQNKEVKLHLPCTAGPNFKLLQIESSQLCLLTWQSFTQVCQCTTKHAVIEFLTAWEYETVILSSVTKDQKHQKN